MEDIRPIVRRPKPAIAPKTIKINKTISSPVIDYARESHVPSDFEPDAGRPRYFLWGVAIASVLILFISLSYVFGGATITITPKTEKHAVDETFQASKDSEMAGVVSYDLMTLSEEKSKDISSSGTKEVKTKATGKVVLSNSFGVAPQHLKEETRLLAPSGKIYKIVGPVDIPGQKIVDGKTVSGTVTVDIFAENAGEEYNTTGPIDLKIFGFKGNPKYDKFSGHAELPITGGKIGTEPGVDDADLSNTKESLKKEIMSSLLEKAKAQLPPGYLIYENATFTKEEDVPLKSSVAGITTVTEKIILNAFIFNEKKLTKAVATKVINDFDGSDIVSKDIKDLDLELVGRESIAPDTVKDVSFTLKGDINFISSIPVEKISKELVGTSKSDFETTMQKYPSVLSATISVKPFWKNSLPNTTDKISIIVNDPTVKPE